MLKFESHNKINTNKKIVTISNPIIKKPSCEITSKSLYRIRSHVISRMIEVHKNYVDALTFHLKVCTFFKKYWLIFTKLSNKI